MLIPEKTLDQWSLLEGIKSRSVFDDSLGFTVRSEGDPPTSDFDSDAAYDYSGDMYDFMSRASAGIAWMISERPFRRPFISRVRAARTPSAGLPGRRSVTASSRTTSSAHEFGHGLTSFTAALIYQNQPGQLNESYSDVWGETVDLLNGNAAFPGALGGTHGPPTLTTWDRARIRRMTSHRMRLWSPYDRQRTRFDQRRLRCCNRRRSAPP